MTGNEQKRTPKDGPRVEGGSRDARKAAAVVLEVLGGAVHPRQGAALLSVGLPRYYQIERRALEGLVKGCEPAPRGRREKDPATEAQRLERRLKVLERELLRYQALARVSQRAVGLTAPKAMEGKRRRKAPVRALKVVRTLRKPELEAAEAAAQG